MRRSSPYPVYSTQADWPHSLELDMGTLTTLDRICSSSNIRSCSPVREKIKTMKFWRWLDGRQKGTSYRKFPLFSFRLFKWGFDGYILKYEPSTVLDWHTDPVVNGKHWRKNWTLKGRALFSYVHDGYGNITSTFEPVWFRPDIQSHNLVVDKKGCTKLSLGFVKFDK